MISPRKSCDIDLVSLDLDSVEVEVEEDSTFQELGAVEPREVKGLRNNRKRRVFMRKHSDSDSEASMYSDGEMNVPLLSEEKPSSTKTMQHKRFYKVAYWQKFLPGLVLLMMLIIVILSVIIFYILSSINRASSLSVIPACNVDGSSCVAHRQRFKRNVVASDQPMCSRIGNEILSEKGGNIIDSGIATLICLGIANMQSAGVGGGGFFMYHDRAGNRTHLVNARETAPSKAFKDMYKHDYDAAVNGGLAVAIPGEVAGYWAFHSKFGKLPWKDLFAPTIKMCQDGFPVGSGLELAMRSARDTIHKYPGLKEILIDPKTGDIYQTGDIIKLPKLAVSLERIADGGVSEYYNGSLAKDIVDDIADAGGIISLEDLSSFKVEIEEPLTIKLNDGNTLLAVPPPSSGSLVALIYNIINDYTLRTDTLSCQKASVLFHHRLIEAWKYAYSIRYRMGDKDFVNVTEILKNVTSLSFASSIRNLIDDDRTFEPDHYGPVGEAAHDHGTTHLSVMDQDGNAFSATTSINLYFGSKVVGKRTGIIFDDTMDDFSIPDKPNQFNLPPSKTNFIVPGKRPMSTMCPSIILDKDGDVIMVVGASGGSKILTATSYVMIRALLLNDDLKMAIDAARVHHQWIPNNVEYEFELEQYLLDGLAAKGHTMHMMPKYERGADVQALIRGFIQAYCDVRKGGCPAGS